VRLVPGFNSGRLRRPRGKGRNHTQNLPLKMTSTRIELSFNKVGRLADLSDLAEILFPGNRNQQHAFLVIWLALKWADQHMVPNLADAAREHGVSRRTLERVRAKLRRMGLIEHVSRLSASHGYCDGWVLSSRFERSLGQLVEKVGGFRSQLGSSQEKELLLLQLADARRSAARPAHENPDDNQRGDVKWQFVNGSGFRPGS